MKTLKFLWTVSKARDTYGYNICSLYVNGAKVESCNGGGYDMKGAVLGNWIARTYADRLVRLTPGQMAKRSHWERADPLPRICDDVECLIRQGDERTETFAELCPVCGGPTGPDYHAGKTIDDGRCFYGLTFHDPDFDPGKAIIGTDATDRTLGKDAKGKTVEDAEKNGVSVGLERYQAFYQASSSTPDATHRVPLIDGGCGFSAVEKIMDAIGLKLEWMSKGTKVDVYRLLDNGDRPVERGCADMHPA